MASALIGLVYTCRKNSNEREEIEKHGELTLCKYTFCNPTGKSSDAYVKYYADDKPYRTRAGGCPSNRNVGSYFMLRYSAKDPNEIVVDFSKEVKDSALIKELEHKLEFKYWLDH